MSNFLQLSNQDKIEIINQSVIYKNILFNL